MKKFSISFSIEILFLLLIILLLVRPVENYDFWFHAKNGAYILQTHTLPFTDVFSHTAYGNSAVPYEWLFQVVIYSIYTILGTLGIRVFVAICILLYLLLFRQILKELFVISLVPRIFLIGLLSFFDYEFFVERPQIVGYLIFMATLYIILKRIIIGKNWLWASIPLFFIWTNLHASMILGLYLFFSFAVLLYLRYLLKRDRSDLSIARDLIIFGIVNATITILPPLGIKVYQLLLLFFEKRDFITRVITEWVPLTALSTQFYMYVVIMVAAGVSYLTALFKNIKNPSTLLFLPLIPLGLFVISGIRQTPFAMPALFLITVPFIHLFKPRINRLLRSSIAVFLMILALGAIFYYRITEPNIVTPYPKGAIPFIKGHLTGNMFNEYAIGGYLMYHLGPAQKTFIDGRTDMFLPVVLPEYDEALNRIYKEDSEFLGYFQKLVDKYNISWAILSTNRYALPWRRLARLLRQNPNWQIVFFDDAAEIYVRNDGKNTQTIETFAILSATPFSKKLYREGKREEAKSEYEKMQKLSSSAVSTNALGFMLLEEGMFDEAKMEFNQALEINPSAPAPKMNLAELAARDGNFKEAIALYRKAIADDPERGLAYLRLGQLIVESGGSKDEAKKIWQEGLKSTPDEEILTKLRKALGE